MRFETNREVLEWYEKQPRAITKEFIDSIAWDEVKKYPLDKKFIPVLFYMRDVEVLTDMYHAELRRTPTGKDKNISKFMERWGIEEITHGELLNRFLNEAGIPTEEKWRESVMKNVPKSYQINTRFLTFLTNLAGKNFTATHMTFGAINEISTTQGYRRLMEMANHPVLTHIFRGILREESVHTQFYWSVARLELRKSEYAQKIARFVIKNFWVPVGQGAKLEKDTNYTIATLFDGQDGLECVDKKITKRIQELPGFQGLNTINETIRQIVSPNFSWAN